MGIFEKIFGKKNERAVSLPEPSLVEAVQQTREQIEGELPQTIFTPEAQESPRVVRAQQYKYGKILQSPDGPIVPGCEHGSTGRSSGLPNGTSVHPNDLFPNYISGNIEGYPWREEGGEIIKRLIEKNGIQYVVVARQMLRPEDGENRAHERRYTEMHQLVIPAKEWSIAVVPQLADILKAKGVTKIDNAMPVIELRTDILDRSLPEGWLDSYVKELILNAVSGKPIALQDWDVKEKDFLQKLFYCFICLPENIARQISFGAGLGLADSQDSKVRIAQTKRARRSLRKIGGEWRGTVPEDATFGQRYLMAVVQATGNCTTPRQVMRAISNIPQDIKAETEQRFRILANP